MEHIISIQSVGVLGVSSPISTFIIRLAVNGTPFKINKTKAQLNSSLDVLYKSYDPSLGRNSNYQQVRLLSNVTNKQDIQNMIEEYFQTIRLEDESGNVEREVLSDIGIYIPGFENIEALKQKILVELNTQYTQYIDKNFIF